jgi:Rrf2 family protein
VASLKQPEQYVPIRQISDDLNISFYFLTKTLQVLTRNDIMTSYRGPSGGVALAKPASYITLMDMIDAIDGIESFQRCILGLPGCGEENPCPLHAYWGEPRNKIRSIFENTSLAELAEEIKKDGLRLVGS